MIRVDQSRHLLVVLPVLAAAVAGMATPWPALATPEYGLAAEYAHDVGIESDPRVVFVESFDAPDLEAVQANWDEAQWPENMALVEDAPPLSGGTKSLHAASSAALYRRLLPGYDEIYVRYYVKIDPACAKIHHWPWLGGRNPPTSYPFPQAGLKPTGADRWSSGVEPFGDEWAWDFYTYWKDQGCSPDNMCWGNTFNRTDGGSSGSPFPAVKGEWLSVEHMVKMNSPVDAKNGEQAFWIDGEKLSHVKPGSPIGNWVWDKFVPDASGNPFDGFQWRTVPELAINYFWLEHYVDSDPSCQAWFDDVVIATSYIGPTVEKSMPPSGTGGADGSGGGGGGALAGGAGPASGGGADPEAPPTSMDSNAEGCSCTTGGGDARAPFPIALLLLGALLASRRSAGRPAERSVLRRRDQPHGPTPAAHLRSHLH